MQARTSSPTPPLVHAIAPLWASVLPWLVPQAEGAEPKSGFERYWTYEFLRVDGQPITVRKVVIGSVLLVLGFFFARFLSRFLRRILHARFKLSEGGLAALESLGFYVLLAVFSLSAFGIAGVPLTAFTLLGGAAAIGIGFGSQTLVSNFIAGLILQAERPIRVGDLIQTGDLFGTVARIGARSTLIRTGENVEIIVPNSSFLEENVVNWTLTDPQVRVHMSVGVAYGSPTERVRELLLEAAASDEAVLPSPEPFVLFTDFGDNALHFELHFWLRIRNMMDRRRVESRIRFKVDALFRDSDVVIAFPQRDVHLDASAPFDVRLVESGRE